MPIVTINPEQLYDGAAVGLSQATVDTDSGLVFVSGQVDWDSDSRRQHDGIVDQAEAAFANLMIALQAAGSGTSAVLQLRIYVRGEVADHLPAVAPLLPKYFGNHRPALTGVGVASLAEPDLLIEIEAVAKVMR
ncbi:RidA family protein [Saccharospirillum mangrovi]|uniref:RidA family protein n=1 Tax=Saccharospirillum mangrovi TaxID=2161747 RepID=UPI000D3B28BA|nr:RidA family protein [Saccharospirillum mangrovi]